MIHQSATHSRSSSFASSNGMPPTFDDLVPQRPPTTQEAEETHLVIPGLDQPIKLKVDAGPGCGGIAWPAGEVLTKYLAYRHSVDSAYLKDKTVVELGSGTGLTGIGVNMLEPSSKVWVTDQDMLLELMRQNVELNLRCAADSDAPAVTVAELDWGKPLPSSVPKAEDIDIVLAADCVYFEPAFPLLVDTLCQLSPIGKQTEILFCWKKRRKADRRFFTMLKKHFAQVHVEDDAPGEREKYNREGVSLMRLTRTK